MVQQDSIEAAVRKWKRFVEVAGLVNAAQLMFAVGPVHAGDFRHMAAVACVQGHIATAQVQQSSVGVGLEGRFQRGRQEVDIQARTDRHAGGVLAGLQAASFHDEL